MNRIGATLFVVAVAFFSLTASMVSPAQAQATRTWVSGVGDDVNPCSRTAPCKTFAGAITKTAPGGEINCIDPGGFGGVTITKAITIQCIGLEAGVLVTGTNGITVQAGATDDVYLYGLDIFGTANSLSGVKFNSGASLHIDHCIIRQFRNTDGVNGWGVNFAPSAAADLFINDTVIANNGNATAGGNVLVAPTANAVVNVALERVLMNDGGVGVRADGTGASPLRVEVADSEASGNIYNAFTAFSTSGKVTLMLRRSVASGNGSTGVKADGANAKALLGDSVISGNATGVATANSGIVMSYQTNQIDLNGNDGTPVPSIALH